MRVSPQSQVQDQNSYLYKWDTTARKYFNHFEIHKQAAKEGIHKLFQNAFTAWRDPIQYRDRFQCDISKAEVYELNKVFSPYSTGLCYQKSVKEPAGIFIWRGVALTAVWGLCTGLAAYALVVKKYNILWIAGSYAPLWTLMIYNYARQPEQQIENCYKYLLAKRAATCEHEKNQNLDQQNFNNYKNQARFAQNEFTKTPEFQQLQQYLRSNNKTLYQLEGQLVGKISNGDLK